MITAVVAPQSSPGFYEITFNDHSGCCVAVSRSLESFKELNAKLGAVDYLSSNTELLLPQHDNPDSLDLARYLNSWLNYYSEFELVTEALSEFMEDSPDRSAVTQLRFNMLRAKIARLTEMNRQYEVALSNMVQKSAQLTDMVNILQLKLGSSSSSFDDECPVRANRTPSESSETRSTPVPTITLSPTSGDSREMSLQFPLTIPESHYAESTNIDDETPRTQSASSSSSGKHTYSQAEIRNNADLLWRMGQAEQQVQRFDPAVQEVLNFVQPHHSQITYRASVVALIKRQVRSMLRVNAFECSLHVLRCFLPDDPTRLTVILGRTRVAQWHKTLHDRLTVLAEQPELSRAACPVDDDFAMDGDDEFPVFDHVLTKVQVASEDANFKVDCVVDSIEASISCNRRGDICMLAFLEEFSLLVGQDDLFKRSLQLIRAWWFYETAAYVGASIRHYIPDGAMCIMVCAVFNQFHMRISSPLQALCLFLAEYSAYDGATQAITLQGIVPYPESSQLVLKEPHESNLVTAAIMDKHWVLVNIQEATASAQHFNQAQQITEELNEDLTRGSFLTKGHKHSYQSVYPGVRSAAQRAYAQGTSRFERSGFNVANPFVNANMVEKLVTRRLQKVQKAFVAGAIQCFAVFSRAAGEENVAIRALFPVVCNRFGRGFVRPDHIGETAPNLRHAQFSETQLMVVPVERIMNQILYCNFVLESILSDYALLALCTEILKEKKVQPVGEVGKMLAEITSSPNLSAKLKEKFGGLKKFLEYFTGRFVFSNDHPFNPSVTLRSILDAMNLEPSEKGVVNLTNIYKARKNGAKRISPMPSPDTSYGSMQSGLGSPYYQTNGQLTPSSASTTARSMATYTISPPGSNAVSGLLPSGGGGVRPELYGTYGTGMGARGKINAYGQQGTEQLWIAEQNRPRPMTSGGGPVTPGYSPRQSIQRAQMGLGLQPPPSQQVRVSPQYQQGQPLIDRSPRQQPMQAPAQQQQLLSQYAPSPQMYMPARGYGVRSLQQQQQLLPPQPPMQSHLGSNNSVYSVRGGNVTPTPLYARQQGPSGLSNSQHSSPQGQSQLREMEPPRFAPSGMSANTAASGAGSNPGSGMLRQGGGGSLYQQRSHFNQPPGLSDEGPNYNVIRDMDLGLNLNEFPNAESVLSLNHNRDLASASSGLSGASFSGTNSRSSTAGPNTQDEEQWY